MLIVNADDLGRSCEDTDSALACYARGRIDSVSAMVHMADSERAARVARQAGIPIGLHLNLSEPFSGNSSARLQASHERVCRFLRSSKYALLLYNPLLRQDFAVAVAGQLEEFRRLYGREPAHIDGHQHMHLCTNVLLQRLLPKGVRVRRSFSFTAAQKGRLNRWYRTQVDRHLALHHPITDAFFSLSQQLTGARMGAMAALSRRSDVELMVHTAWSREYDYLMSDAFGVLLRSVRQPDQAVA
jgi:chitin disaccharide deacetylase